MFIHDNSQSLFLMPSRS